MNSANFHEYLRNPSMLHQVNYQELKSLALQYPYSANLRYLMLVKSLLDGNREYDRNLVLASLGSIDRQKLQQLVKQYTYLSKVSGNYEISGEFLELKDLSTLEEVLEAGPTEAPKAMSADVPNAGVGLDFLDDLEDEPLEESNPDIDLDDVGLNGLEELVGNAPSVGSSNSLDELFEMDKPLTNRLREEDVEDLEIEEHASGLFEDDVEMEDELEQGEMPGVGMLEDGVGPHLDPPSEDAGGQEAINEALSESKEMMEDDDVVEKAGDMDEGVETAVTIAATISEILDAERSELLDDSGSGSTDETEENMAGEPTLLHEDIASLDKIPLEITNDKEEVIQEQEVFEPKPLSKSAFSSYQHHHRAKSGLLTGGFHLLTKEEKKAAKVPKLPEHPLGVDDYEEPKDVAKEVAAQSLSEDNTIATETLAGILERQGHFDKAIKMYEKLSLQYPEKSSTFAAKIEKLRKR